MKKIGWIILFLIVLLTHLVAIYSKEETLLFISKPLLMPLLAIYLLNQTRPFRSNLKLWIIFALFFSWAGDILLMFEETKTIFFLLGLFSFLLAQIFYIISFNGIRIRESIRGNALFLLLGVIYYSVLISILSPFLGDMKLPVKIYGVVLSFMLILAMHTILGKNKRAGVWMMSGAILFVASDSLLAFNKFYAAFNCAGIIIMLTYGLAQLFITYGAVIYLNSEETK